MLDRLLAELKPPVAIGAGEIRVAASIGAAEAPRDATTASELMRRADIALYRAKECGGDTLCRFEAQLESERDARREIEDALGGALERNEFVITYQPQVEVASGRVIGFETLLRWDHPQLGRLLPTQFIAMAEEMHLITRLDLYGPAPRLHRGRRAARHVDLGQHRGRHGAGGGVCSADRRRP